MPLDLVTLYFVSGLVTGTSSLLFLLEVRRQPDAPAYKWWGLAFLCAIAFLFGFLINLAGRRWDRHAPLDQEDSLP